LKNRERKFQDQRRRRRGDYFRDMATAQKENIQLTVGYKNFTKQFKLLQQKYKRFEKSDENRISLIQSMNEHEAKALVEKIMNADKVIHLQQLNVPWKPPTDPLFSFLNQGNDAGNDQLQNNANAGLMNQNTSVMDSQNQAMSKSDPMLPVKSENNDDQQSAATGTNDANKEKFEKIKNVFMLLIEETPFLIDDKSAERAAQANQKEAFQI